MVYFTLLVGTLFLIAFYKIRRVLYDLVVLKIRTYSIPGLKGLPFIGNAIDLMAMPVQDQVQWILKHSREFKDGFYKIWIGPNILIFFTMPRHIEKILPSTVHIKKLHFYDGLVPWLGEGLITVADREKWARDRKLITPTFHFSILEKYVPAMNQKCQLMLKCIEQKMKENPTKSVEIYSIVNNCALDILCETSMGIDVHAQEKDIEYTRAVHKFSELTFHRMLSPWNKYKWIHMLSSYGRDYYAQLKILHQFTNDVIRKRIEWRKAHEYESDDNDTREGGYKRERKALLDHLLDASENSLVPMSEQEIREQIDTFMFAGHDTTAAAFAWMLFCLGNSPEHQDKVHEELDAVFGNSDRPVTLKDLTELKYLERVLKESLRMYPSVPLINRYITEDIDLGKYIIPKGANVGISPILTHRHPDIWPNPEKFDPDRFLPENTKNRHPYAYIPFSAGPRNCIGQKFAQIEEKIMAAYILRRWEIKSVLRQDQMEMLLPIVLKPLNGIYLHLTPRKRSVQ